MAGVAKVEPVPLAAEPFTTLTTVEISLVVLYQMFGATEVLILNSTALNIETSEASRNPMFARSLWLAAAFRSTAYATASQ